MLRNLSAAVATRLGYRPVGRDWAERLPQLQGRFRRSRYENGLRIFAAALVLMPFVLMAQLPRGRADLQEPFILGCMVVAIGLAGFQLWPLGRSYVLENGELRYESRGGRVLWREDLRGIQYVTCLSGGGRTIMSLKWSDRRRRIELFESLEKALSRHRHR